MTRYLIVTLPLAGHVYPALGLARELAAHGHDVAWAGSEMMLRPLVGDDATVFRTGSRLFREQGGSGMAAIKSLWLRFILPYGKFILPGVDKAVRAYEPDVLLVDQHAAAGAIVAHRHGLPWVTLAVSAMELTEPYRSLPKVSGWMTDLLRTMWTNAGLPAEEFVDPRQSPYLTLAYTTPELVGTTTLDDRVRLVGPMLTARPGAPDFPYDWLDPDRKHVLITMGTLAGDVATDFYGRAIEAFTPLAEQLQVIIVAPPGELPEPPEHIMITPSVPLLRLMPRLDVVVGHGGINTVAEALSNGVPMVIAPIRHDQPIVAAQVAAAGAGLRVKFRRVRPTELATAVTTVLADPSYRDGATRIAESFRAAGGSAAAVRLLERLQQTVSDRTSSVVQHSSNALA
ncbi:MAG TPA: nucleotide disphospho-sugar-binding domain-containing protein [Pseudonocardiaceae bacterium]